MEYPDFQSAEGCHDFSPANSMAVLGMLLQDSTFATEKFVTKVDHWQIPLSILEKKCLEGLFFSLNVQGFIKLYLIIYFISFIYSGRNILYLQGVWNRTCKVLR